MEIRDRITSFIRELPVAHRVGIAAALAALAMVGVVFVRWVTSPSYTVLYSGLDDAAVSAVIDGLETHGVAYRLEAGGSRVLVPREQLYTTRAALAAEGVAGNTTPPGYELLDGQGLSVSDFRQRVDYQRALEGELSRTLSAMDGIGEATVHLVLPEEELFAERQQPVTASVLLATGRTLRDNEVEAVTFLVASSVEGLEVDQITVADATGTVLHAPGDAGGASVATNRNLRQTREFEQALADDIGTLLTRVSGAPASVVVRSTLDFDEQTTETEAYDPDAQVALREQTGVERFEGTGTVPGGAVGLDGGPLTTEGGESSYERDEVLREFGVDKVTTRVVAAPGRVEGMSVAIVMDDGSLTGAEVPPDDEIEQLVAAAVGLDEARGDVIAVSTMPFPPVEEEEVVAEDGGLTDYVPKAIGALVLLVVATSLFLMTRRRNVVVEEIDRRRTASLPHPEPTALAQAEPEPDPAAVAAVSLQSEVAALVERQPEEIATLLRGWLADRRAS